MHSLACKNPYLLATWVDKTNRWATLKKGIKKKSKYIIKAILYREPFPPSLRNSLLYSGRLNRTCWKHQDTNVALPSSTGNFWLWYFSSFLNQTSTVIKRIWGGNLLWKPVKGNSNMKTKNYTQSDTEQLSRVEDRGKSRKSIRASRTETEKWKKSQAQKNNNAES